MASARRARTGALVSCEEVCCNCGNDIGPHHLCIDCLGVMSGVVCQEQEGSVK